MRGSGSGLKSSGMEWTELDPNLILVHLLDRT